MTINFVSAGTRRAQRTSQRHVLESHREYGSSQCIHRATAENEEGAWTKHLDPEQRSATSRGIRSLFMFATTGDTTVLSTNLMHPFLQETYSNSNSAVLR